MRTPLLRAAWPLALALALPACNNDAPVEPSRAAGSPLLAASAAGTVRISEFHYDNSGTDSGEAVEVMGPAGTRLAGWSIVLYNGSGGAPYNTALLSGAIPATCGAEGVVVTSYPSNGIQNGSPDGIALVDSAGRVVEFLSYEGSFTAVGGPANGMVSVDVGASQSGSTSGDAIQRTAAGTWARLASTLGSCNGGPPPPPPPSSPIVINEVLANPGAVVDSLGEWFEVLNRGTAPVDLNGWQIASGSSTGGDPVHTITGSVVVPAGGFVVIARSGNADDNGGVTASYVYGATAINLSNSADWLALRNATGGSVDSVTWSATTTGASRGVVDAAADNTDMGGANWNTSTTPFGLGDKGTPGAANRFDPPPPGSVGTISLSASGGTTFPAGYTMSVFATVRDASGANVTPFPKLTWTSSNTGVATVDSMGYVSGVSVGTATIRATAPNGVAGQLVFNVTSADVPTPAVYRDHVEFGVPTGIGGTVLRKPQYVLSYDAARGGPTWVAWNLNATHFGSEDRCNCFTADAALPSGTYRVVDSDYRGSGYDRGHMVQSFNRTTTAVENASTFLLTNILPQAANNNQGPWGQFESHVNDVARGLGGQAMREAYVVAGGEYSASPQTLKGEGKVQVPEFTWKVVVFVAPGKGLADVRSTSDLEVVAVRMPNDTAAARNIRNTPWQTFKTSTDAIEAATGLDLLAGLPDRIERIVESNDRAPVAATDGPYTGTEGSAVALSAAGSSDPDGDALTYEWDFGDGTTGTGATPTHTYADNGNFIVKVTVTDPYGAESTATTSVMVVNVAPAVAAIPGASLLPGETFTASGTFGDPGSDSWTATVNYGDGSGAKPLALSGKGFSLSHVYAAAGTYTVTVTVTDDDGDGGTRTATVTVMTAQQGIAGISAMVDGMVAAGTLSRGEGNALDASLKAASQQLDRRDGPAAVNQLGAFVNKVEAMRESGRLSAADAQRLIAAANRVVRSIS